MREIFLGAQRVSVGKIIGKGGEGEVYQLLGQSGLVVKLYNDKYRADREDKVRAMVYAGLSNTTNLVAYPITVATNSKGKFVGFTMRLIPEHRPVHELYSPKSRQRHFPNADYRFVIRAALNVARAVGKVHKTGCIVGDLNHSGVLVSKEATVALIDADSFQFRLGSLTYPCVVGVPEFTPPELHGVRLDRVNRTIDHDNFGLAVAIFHFLFMGRHPYAGKYIGPDISMGEAIAQNRFAFSLKRASETRTTPPPGALSLDLFPTVVSDAFEYAFGKNPTARPGASDWIAALTKLEGSLNRCRNVKTHYYPGKAKSCVWCDLAGRSSFDMFPDLSTVTSTIQTDTQGTEQAIREILAFRFPTAAELLVQASPSTDSGSSRLIAAKSGKSGRALIGLFIMGGAVLGIYFESSLLLVWLFLGGWGFSIFNDRAIDTRSFYEAFKKADEQVQSELDAFVRRNGLSEVIRVRAELEGTITTYKKFGDYQKNELKKFHSSREERQRAAYLDQFSIRSASIPNLGPARKAMLFSFGIETAADISQHAVLGVPGFGEVLTGNLLDWRRMHESRFRYNRAPTAKDAADERAFRTKLANQKLGLETKIRHGLNTLRREKSRLDSLSAKIQSDSAMSKALKDRAQAERDLKLLGAAVPQSTVTLNNISSPQTRPGFSGTQNPNRGNTANPHNVPRCPSCGASMLRRSGKYGRFWGCPHYPACRGTRNI